MAVIDKDLAGDDLPVSYSPTPLYAGDADVITQEAVIDTGALAKYTVLGRITATGKYVAHNPAANDGSEVARAILTQAVDATAADVKAGVYVAGFFNEAALVWAAATNTLLLKQQAFQGTEIHIGTVRL